METHTERICDAEWTIDADGRIGAINGHFLGCDTERRPSDTSILEESYLDRSKSGRL